MGHGLTDKDTMYSVRETPWHRLGTVLETAPANWAEAREASGLTWDTIELPAYRAEILVNEQGEPIQKFVEEEDFKRIVRSDDGTTLNVARKSWEMITHVDMGQIIDVVLGQNDITYETGGSLDGGRKVWALLRIGKGLTVPGDFTPTLPYVVLLNAHDGTSSFQVIPTAVRVVCQNTYHLAEAEASRKGIGFNLRHTKNWRTQVEEMRKAISRAQGQFEQSIEISAELASLYVDGEQREAFVQYMIPMPNATTITQRVYDNVDEARRKLREIMLSETTLPVIGTAYGLAQAGGEYADWIRPARSARTKFGRQLLEASDLKKRAVRGARLAARGELELTA